MTQKVVLKQPFCHRLSLKTEVCHLSDVFQKFSNFDYETYNLDPGHSYTLPGFSLQSMLKMTKIELQLISDSDIYIFLMDCIRGGICVVNKNLLKQTINTQEKYMMNLQIKKLRKN